MKMQSEKIDENGCRLFLSPHGLELGWSDDLSVMQSNQREFISQLG
jgi:hypothetical protein